jgi:rare lipoprotein A
MKPFLFWVIFALYLSVNQVTFGQEDANSIQIITPTQTTDSLSWKPFKKNVLASYYSHKLNGRKTANGDKFDNSLFTAAHKTLPFGTKLKVTNPTNGKSVMVIINDRGPFSKTKEIDITYAAFLEIANHKNQGMLRVDIEKVQ